MIDFFIRLFFLGAGAFACWVIWTSIKQLNALAAQLKAPGCIGSDPSPQSVAENDCFTCYFAGECVREEIRNAW